MRHFLDCYRFDRVGRGGTFTFNFRLTQVWWRSLQIVLFGLVFLLLQASLAAVPIVQHRLAPPDTSSPQATLRSFVENINLSHQLLIKSYDQFQQETGLFPSDSVRKQFNQVEILFARAENCLDLSEIPFRFKRDAATEKTLLLKEVLDRLELPPYPQIPDAETAANGDITRWILPNTQIDIVKVGEGPRIGEFLFSPRTLDRIYEFYQKVEGLSYQPGSTEGFYKKYISTPGSLTPSIVNLWFLGFPSWLGSTTYGGQTLWQWLSMVLTLCFTVWISSKILRWNLRQLSTLSPPMRTWKRLLFPISTIAILSAASYFLDRWVNITGNMQLILLIVFTVIGWTLIAATVILLGNCLAEMIIASPSINSRSLDASTIRAFLILICLAISIFILIVKLESVGIALGPILAGLGIGGLAIALGGQQALQNIIAGLMLYLDRPVKIGERCIFGDKDGYIQQIGLRSTRILSMDGDLISVPNSKFSELELRNKSRRKRILIQQIIGLRYETTSEQLRYAIAKLREMILAHPNLLEDDSRVRFVQYGNYSLDVEIFVYANTGNLLEYLGIKEDVLLRVKEIVEEAGTDFAFPSQTTYLSRDGGLDGERVRDAEEKVKDWRSQGELPFPEFSDEQRDRLRDTLDFPPKGSPRPPRSAEKNDRKD